MKKRNNAILFGLISAFIVFSISVSFSCGYILGYNRIGATRLFSANVINKDKGKPQNLDFSAFWDAWNLIGEKYNGQVDQNKLLQGAIAGMAQATGDPYTVYLNQDELKTLDEQLQGSFEGIGAEIGIKNNYITIISPLENSPAKKADLRSGDIIAKINDKSTDGMTVDEAVNLIKGTKGTSVKLTIVRGEGTLEKTIIRDTVEVKSVSYEIKSNNIGYVKINSFGEETANEVKSALKDLESKKVTGYILDVRSNPGGYLDSAVQIASYFVDSGIVVWEKSKTSENASKTTENRIVKNKPIVVLIDGGSASASEIFAGALRDREGIKLIGEKSYGKGSVQIVENLKGGALKITIAEWLTPKKQQINTVGLKPDIEVKMTDSDINNNLDPQLDRAIEETHK